MQKRQDKNDEKNKNKVKLCKLGDYCLKTSTILVWNQLRIIVSMLGSRGVPSLQSFCNAKRAFVNDTRVIKIHVMVE